MSNRVKAGLCLALFVVLYGYWAYLTWDSSQVIAEQWIALGPINWIDFGSGAITMFFVMMIVFIAITLRETNRFENESGDGGNTGGSGGTLTRRVRLPLRRKVVDITTWQPPPDGRFHHAEAPAPA